MLRGRGEWPADLPAVLGRPEADRVAGLVVEASALPVSEIIDTLKTADHRCAVVVFVPGDLPAEDDRRLRLGVFGGLLRVARTPEQLIEQTSRLLHQRLDSLSEPTRVKLAKSRAADDAVLTGRAGSPGDRRRHPQHLLAGQRPRGARRHAHLCVKAAGPGSSCSTPTPDADVVLVDIMMPDMDGFETMREIRAVDHFADLPIIAVTAKAMKGDRLKCIQAGASDYVSKPVDIDYLVSVLRVSVQKSDALRLASEPITSRLPQVV